MKYFIGMIIILFGIIIMNYLEFKNRFNWISKEQFVENRDYTYLLCEGMNKDDLRCSLVYKKKIE